MLSKTGISVLLLMSFCQFVSIGASYCDLSETVDITNGTKHENGYIYHEGVYYSPKYYEYYNYTINGTNDEIETQIRGCVCLLKPCIKTCCDQGQVRKLNSNGCFDFPELGFSANITLINGQTKFQEVNRNQFGFIQRLPCKQITQLEHDFFDDEKWQILINGSIKVENPMIGTTDQFCLSNVLDDDDNMIGTFAYFCYIESKPEIRSVIYSHGMIVSLPFLFITLIIHLSIPELRNLHGKIVICYVITLISAFTSLPLIQLRVADKSAILCQICGYWFYYSILACFFWLNVMSFDIWSNITGRIPQWRKESARKKFWKYLIYAFCTPGIFLAFALVMDNTSINDQIKPNIGKESCYLNTANKTVYLIYYHGPLFLIFIANIFLFSRTSYYIYQVKKQTAAAFTNDSHVHNASDKERLGLYIRFFVLMGLTWISEIISWILGDESFIFYIADLIHCLHGVTVFFLFVLRSKVKKLLRQRLFVREVTATTTLDS